jgi:hypothetical protein
MSEPARAKYRRSSADERVRVVVLMPKEEVQAIDFWGIPSGMRDRTAAVRTLIRKGLEAAGAPAAGQEA